MERVYGEKVKVTYNVEQTASMVSNRMCHGFDTWVEDQMMKLFINLSSKILLLHDFIQGGWKVRVSNEMVWPESHNSFRIIVS